MTRGRVTAYDEGFLESVELRSIEAVLMRHSTLDDDANASASVHAVTVADLADAFTWLDLTDSAASCR